MLSLRSVPWTRLLAGAGVLFGTLALSTADARQLIAQQVPVPAGAPADSTPSLAPYRSPRGAFLRSLVIPGWGQAWVGSPGRGAVYFAMEASSGWMLYKTQSRLSDARRRVEHLENIQPTVVGDTIALHDARRLAKSRSQQRESGSRSASLCSSSPARTPMSPRSSPISRSALRFSPLPTGALACARRFLSAHGDEQRRAGGHFDSGVGGLSVAHEIRRLLPEERLLYVADTAFCPYGGRPIPEIRARSLVVGRYLVECGVKAIVVACNTASGAALEALREALPIPVVGIEPAVKPAAAATRTGRVGVLATARRCSPTVSTG